VRKTKNLQQGVLIMTRQDENHWGTINKPDMEEVAQQAVKIGQAAFKIRTEINALEQAINQLWREITAIEHGIGESVGTRNDKAH